MTNKQTQLPDVHFLDSGRNSDSFGPKPSLRKRFHVYSSPRLQFRFRKYRLFPAEEASHPENIQMPTFISSSATGRSSIFQSLLTVDPERRQCLFLERPPMNVIRPVIAGLESAMSFRFGRSPCQEELDEKSHPGFNFSSSRLNTTIQYTIANPATVT